LTPPRRPNPPASGTSHPSRHVRATQLNPQDHAQPSGQPRVELLLACIEKNDKETLLVRCDECERIDNARNMWLRWHVIQ
jgi:hypothetical protein